MNSDNTTRDSRYLDSPSPVKSENLSDSDHGSATLNDRNEEDIFPSMDRNSNKNKKSAAASESPCNESHNPIGGLVVQPFESIKHKTRIRSAQAATMSLEGDETAKQATVPLLKVEDTFASAATAEMTLWEEESPKEQQGALLHPTSNGENGHGSSQGASAAAEEAGADHQLQVEADPTEDSSAESGTRKAFSPAAILVAATTDPKVAEALVVHPREPADGTKEANTIDPTINDSCTFGTADESPMEIDASSKSVDPPGAENANAAEKKESNLVDNANTELAIAGNGHSDPFGLIDTGRLDLHKEAVDAPSDGPANRSEESPLEEEKKDASPVEAALDKSVVPAEENVQPKKTVEVDSTKHQTGNLVAARGSAGSVAYEDPTDETGPPPCSDENDDRRTSMDASGRCLVDGKPNEENSHTHDPPDSHPPSTRLTDIQETNEDECKMTPEVLQTNDDKDETKQRPPLEPIQTMDIGIDVAVDLLPTPVFGATKRLNEAAIRLAAEAGPDHQTSHLPIDLLANKEKESFGLLARAESFRINEAESFRIHEAHMQQQIISQQHIDYTSSHHRAPQDPDAVHRRGESSVAALPRRNSGRGDLVNDSIPRNMMLDENSNRPFDDNSWRPSQVSYTHSPQGVHVPQAIALTTSGHYMMMQQPQAQPPHAFLPQAPAMLHHQSSFHSHQTQLLGQPAYAYAPVPAMQQPMLPTSETSRKRKIKLKLQEEILARPTHARKGSFFFGGRSTRKMLTSQPLLEDQPQTNEVDRGVIAVSWYEGTSTTELQEHVKASALRKLKLENGQQLDDIRIIDTTVDPPEEVVLSPYIPNGSEFVLRYKLKLVSGRSSPVFYGPPDSPSAAPSPFPSHGNLGSLDDSQIAVLRKQLDDLQASASARKARSNRVKIGRSLLSPLKPNHPDAEERKNTSSPKEGKSSQDSDNSDGDNDNESETETNTLPLESSVDVKLRQITELLLMEKDRQQRRHAPQVEKRQVVFVLANYFVLFVACITISAEIQARAPRWLSWVEGQLVNVQNCSADQDALYKCISNGEFAGLFATVILWLSRSATTKQIFLFGFDSPKKLWTVFYESLVGAFCWGVSYMFIRRGMNPDTRPQFLQKYWKDCVYGSLAGFNATFMKQVLKNLIPQEAVEEAFNDRQLKILSWLPSFA